MSCALAEQPIPGRPKSKRQSKVTFESFPGVKPVVTAGEPGDVIEKIKTPFCGMINSARIQRADGTIGQHHEGKARQSQGELRRKSSL